jgi:hypothetical protein
MPPKANAKAEVKPVVTADEVVNDEPKYTQAEVIAMLRGLNNNSTRLAVIEWLRNSMEEQPKVTEPEKDQKSIASD